MFCALKRISIAATCMFCIIRENNLLKPQFDDVKVKHVVSTIIQE
jgi:hypothetical protein